MKFSIGIPAYKAKFLKECIDSVLSQTYSDFELIIVNDASPEDIDSIVKEYRDPRIRYFKNEKNTGTKNIVDNWNICLFLSQGDFFVLMGDDDKMMSNYLVEFTILIDKYSTLDVYHCRSLTIDENSQPLIYTPSWPEYETVYENIFHRIEGYRHHFISDFVYRTSALKEQGGFYKLPLAWASDDITSYIAAKDNGIAHIQKPVFLYRRNTLSISYSDNIVLKMTAIKKEEKWFDIFLQSTPSEESDIIFHTYIKNNISKYFFKKRIYYLSKGMKKNRIWHFFNFLFHKKELKISFKELVYSLIWSLK